MKELLKSFGNTFVSTLLPIVIGVSVGVGLAQGLIYILNQFGVNVAIITLFVSLFLYAWILNAVSDYRLNKVKEKIDKEYEEFRARFENLK